MKNERTFRQNFILIFIASVFISLILSMAGFVFLVGLYREFGDSSVIIRSLRLFVLNTVGDVNFFLIIILLAFIMVFFTIFFIMSNNSIKVIDNVSESLKNIAKGDFDDTGLHSGENIHSMVKNADIARSAIIELRERETKAQKEKDALVINIAHDLRTPLTSIKGYLGLIKDKDNLTEMQRIHYVEIAYDKAIKMERLIDDLFQFTKLNYSNEPIKKENINLTALISQVADEFYPIFTAEGLEGRLSAPENAPVYIAADGDLIARLIENILSNAVRYGKTGKYIDITLKKDTVNALIEIKNYDSYIPGEEIRHIFGNFYRTEQSRSSETGGSGIGLAIAKNIADMHGGTIKVDSSMEYTAFIIMLPHL